MSPRADARFFESTRGQIVSLLRKAPSTVDELASALELTPNAVRLHLGTLERDGTVRPRGVRRGGGVGKPATEYEISEEAESSFSNAYVPFLVSLLGAIGGKLPSAELKALMRDVGHRLAGDTSNRPASVRARVNRASELLNALGGITTVETDKDGTLRIQGCSCPLAVAVGEREEVCVAVQTMLRDVVGVAVKEECDRSERPRCHFAIPA